MHGKKINQVPIIDYKKLHEIDVDFALVATANAVIEPHIISQIRKQKKNCEIFSFTHENSAQYDRPTTVEADENTLLDLNKIKSEPNSDGAQAIEDLIKWARHTSG